MLMEVELKVSDCNFFKHRRSWILIEELKKFDTFY